MKQHKLALQNAAYRKQLVSRYMRALLDSNNRPEKAEIVSHSVNRHKLDVTVPASVASGFLPPADPRRTYARIPQTTTGASKAPSVPNMCATNAVQCSEVVAGRRGQFRYAKPTPQHRKYLSHVPTRGNSRTRGSRVLNVTSLAEYIDRASAGERSGQSFVGLRNVCDEESPVEREDPGLQRTRANLRRSIQEKRRTLDLLLNCSRMSGIARRYSIGKADTKVEDKPELSPDPVEEEQEEDYRQKLETLCKMPSFSEYEGAARQELERQAPDRSYGLLKESAQFESNYSSSISPLSETDLQRIRDFFSAPTPSLLPAIEQLAASRFFLPPMSRAQRRELLIHSSFRQYQKGDRVFDSVSTFPDIIFVLTGSVKVQNTTREFFVKMRRGQTYAEDLFMESESYPTGYTRHYDDRFSATALENSTAVITIPRSVFRELVLRELRAELFRKLYVLKLSRIFRQVSINQLIRLSRRTRFVMKYYWETVQRQETVPACCSVIFRGVCKSTYVKSVSPIGSSSRGQRTQAWRFGLSSYSAAAASGEGAVVGDCGPADADDTLQYNVCDGLGDDEVDPVREDQGGRLYRQPSSAITNAETAEGAGKRGVSAGDRVAAFPADCGTFSFRKVQIGRRFSRCRHPRGAARGRPAPGD